MSTAMDDRISIKKESVYGTLVVTDRFYPMVDDSSGDWDPMLRDGEGLRGGTGRRTGLAARNFPTIGQGVVTLRVELESKAAGVAIEAALGVLTVTSITGGTQQLGHPGISGTYMPSYTIQLVKVSNAGTERVETYGGCTPSKSKIVQPPTGVAYLEIEFDAASYTTAVGAATVTYATDPTLFDAFQNTVAVGTSGLSVPTTTALASGLTADTTWKEWSVEIDHQIDTEDWRLSSRGRPIASAPEIEFSGQVAFDTNTLPDAVAAGTKLSWYATTTTTEVLGAGFAQLQVCVPKLVVPKGLPQVKRGETRVCELSGSVRNDGTNQDVYVAYRTADVAA